MSRRLNIAYLTSLRELVSERCGSFVNGTRRIGCLETLVRHLNNPTDPLASRFSLAAILVDDDDFNEHHRLWPNDLGVLCGEKSVPLSKLYHAVPSSTWALPRPAHMLEPDWHQWKTQAKEAYEASIVAFLRQKQIDLLILDSYVRIVGDVLLEAYRRRILNIHPSILKPGDPRSLPGRHPTRDAYTRENFGWVIVDDKHSVALPQGANLYVEWQGKKRIARKMDPIGEVGATVHEVEKEVDLGPTVKMKTVPLRAADLVSEDSIRSLTYPLKNRVLAEALMEYIDPAPFSSSIAREACADTKTRECSLI